MATRNNDVPKRILDAALDIVDAHGIQALTQPRLAKATGLRQSHLTYYFPRKADLYAALLEASHERVRLQGASQDITGHDDVPAMLRTLVSDSHRMRFFLSILLVVSEEPQLLSALRSHAAHLAEAVATHFGREPGDCDVVMFVDCLRGLGLRLLMEPDNAADRVPSIDELAAQFGLCEHVNDTN